MKTLNLITIAIMILGLNAAFAGSDPAINAPSVVTLTYLQPVSPSEATFSDVVPEPAPRTAELAPVVSKVAPFSESGLDAVEESVLMREFSPVTPSEAGFEVESNVLNDSLSLIPSIPKEASFSDTL